MVDLGPLMGIYGGVLLVLRFGVFDIVVALDVLRFTHVFVLVRGMCVACMGIYLEVALLPFDCL